MVSIMSNLRVEVRRRRIDESKVMVVMDSSCRIPEDSEFTLKSQKSNVYELTINNAKLTGESTCHFDNLTERLVLCEVTDDKMIIEELPLVFQVGLHSKNQMEVNNKKSPMDFIQKKTLVVNELGTNKSKKILNHQLTRQIEEDTIAKATDVKTALETKGVQLTSDHVATSERDILVQKIIPLRNEGARNVSEIYPLECVCAAKDLSCINIESFKDSFRNKQLSIATKHLLDYNKVNVETLSEESLKRYAVLDTLLHLNAIKSIKVTPKSWALERKLTPALVVFLFKEFLEQMVEEDGTKTLVLTKFQGIRLTIRILILSLHLCNFKVPASSILPQLKLNLKSLTSLCKEIGCVLNKKGEQTFVRLVMPKKIDNQGVSKKKFYKH